jgi:hypothetical protein
MTLVPPEPELEKYVICVHEIGDEEWFVTSTGEQGTRPREKFQLVLCASCAEAKIPRDFQKLVVDLFDTYG